MRALYQRSKGRDLFDLWKARELKPDWEKTAKIFLKYMEKTNKHVHRDLMNNNLQNKLTDPRFNGDLNALLNSSQNYNAHKAAKWVASEIYSNVPKSHSQSLFE